VLPRAPSASAKDEFLRRPAAKSYGVATMSRLLKITGLFCRLSSLL